MEDIKRQPKNHTTLEDKIRMVNYARKHELTYEEIGKIFNITRERVRQIVSPYVSKEKGEIIPVDRNILDRIFG